MSRRDTIEVMELASLVKDNLSCKHLVLSVEGTLVNFLQDDRSPEGVLELQPMSPYHRLLLHRLADIYGFAHESVGEGDDRHLILERCPDTAIPSILVSDILWHDEFPSPTSSPYVLRKNDIPELKKNGTLPSSTSFEEREAAYLAARERIFSLHENDEKEVAAPKSRKIPVVAQRMIAHALGAKVSSNAFDQKLPHDATSMEAPSTKKSEPEIITSISKHSKEKAGKVHWHEKKICDKPAGKNSRPNDSARKGNIRPPNSSSRKGNSTPEGKNERVIDIENSEREQIGAAKRIFAQALGFTPGRVNGSAHLKANQGNKGM